MSNSIDTPEPTTDRRTSQTSVNSTPSTHLDANAHLDQIPSPNASPLPNPAPKSTVSSSADTSASPRTSPPASMPATSATATATTAPTRIRAARACTSCNRQKLRCDGQRPCARCVGMGGSEACEYLPSMRGKTRRKKGDIAAAGNTASVQADANGNGNGIDEEGLDLAQDRERDRILPATNGVSHRQLDSHSDAAHYPEPIPFKISPSRHAVSVQHLLGGLKRARSPSPVKSNSNDRTLQRARERASENGFGQEKNEWRGWRPDHKGMTGNGLTRKPGMPALGDDVNHAARDSYSWDARRSAFSTDETVNAVATGDQQRNGAERSWVEVVNPLGSNPRYIHSIPSLLPSKDDPLSLRDHLGSSTREAEARQSMSSARSDLENNPLTMLAEASASAEEGESRPGSRESQVGKAYPDDQVPSSSREGHQSDTRAGTLVRGGPNGSRTYTDSPGHQGHANDRRASSGDRPNSAGAGPAIDHRPRILSVIATAEADTLIEQYFRYLHPQLPVLDPAQSCAAAIGRRSEFLLHAICCVTARNLNIELWDRLRDFAASETERLPRERGIEVVQAHLLYATWGVTRSSPAESDTTYLRLGLAARTALDLNLPRLLNSPGAKDAEPKGQVRAVARTWLLLYVSDLITAAQVGKQSMMRGVVEFGGGLRHYVGLLDLAGEPSLDNIYVASLAEYAQIFTLALDAFRTEATDAGWVCAFATNGHSGGFSFPPLASAGPSFGGSSPFNGISVLANSARAALPDLVALYTSQFRSWRKRTDEAVQAFKSNASDRHGGADESHLLDHTRLVISLTQLYEAYARLVVYSFGLERSLNTRNVSPASLATAFGEYQSAAVRAIEVFDNLVHLRSSVPESSLVRALPDPAFVMLSYASVALLKTIGPQLVKLEPYPNRAAVIALCKHVADLLAQSSSCAEHIAAGQNTFLSKLIQLREASSRASPSVIPLTGESRRESDHNGVSASTLAKQGISVPGVSIPGDAADFRELVLAGTDAHVKWTSRKEPRTSPPLSAQDFASATDTRGSGQSRPSPILKGSGDDSRPVDAGSYQQLAPYIRLASPTVSSYSLSRELSRDSGSIEARTRRSSPLPGTAELRGKRRRLSAGDGSESGSGSGPNVSGNSWPRALLGENGYRASLTGSTSQFGPDYNSARPKSPHPALPGLTSFDDREREYQRRGVERDARGERQREREMESDRRSEKANIVARDSWIDGRLGVR